MKRILGLSAVLALTACATTVERQLVLVQAPPDDLVHVEHVDEAEAELEHAHWQLEVLRMSMQALQEAERPDSAELVEHSIHARELTLEGRDDREAVRIRETAPTREQLIELLMFTRELMVDRGMEEQAEVVGQFEQELRTRTVHRPRERGRDPELAEHVERFMVRVEHLEANLKELLHHVEMSQRKQAEHVEMSQRELLERIERLEKAFRELQVATQEK